MSASGRAAASRPNILFFFTDDQRFDTIRALGNEHIVTPTMDSFVRQGTTFTNAYIMGGTCSAICMPSRAMLMTGRTLFHLEDSGRDIPGEHTLLGEVLQKAGYETFGIGKWHNGTNAYARSFTGGAEIFFGGMNDHWNVPACDYDPSGRYDSRLPACRDAWSSNEVTYSRADHVHAGKHSSEVFADAAVELLRDRDGKKPFFMYVSYMAPHDPRATLSQYHDMYDAARIPLPENFAARHPFDNGALGTRDELLAGFPRTPEEIRGHVADYYAMITHADATMGRVMKALEETGQAGNTVVLFAGDNGLAVGRHGLMGKQSVYDHSVHVPLVMKGPGIPAGERRDGFCYLVDIFPTVCELAGVPVPGTVEGKSLVPTMRDPKAKPRRTLPFAYMNVQRGVRDERWKLTEHVVKAERTTQLFDLENDPLELDDLAGERAAAGELERLRGELVRSRDELDDTQAQGEEFWRGYGAT